MIRRKVCMLGSYAVGKTSLVMRYVKNVFSDRYETTIGVRILKKELMFGGEATHLLLWDLHGEDEFQEVRSSYLRGSSGYLLVADGTRAATLDKVGQIHERARNELGDVPALLLVNKADRRGEWELPEDFERATFDDNLPTLLTSAKTGAGVEGAFLELARRMAKP